MFFGPFGFVFGHLLLPDDNNGVEYDDESIDDTSSLDEYENEVQSIEHFYQRFNQQYNDCPVFFMGSLQEACQAAFNASTIKDRRPVLVYIHHDKSSYSDTFFSNIFCSDSIIECLLENYIVWPWDITYESNRNILKKIWEEIFSDQFAIIFSYQRCPMLIGIMPRPAGKKGWLISSEYKLESILEWNMLTRTQEKLNRETLKNELIIFKKEFDDNEQNLSFNFIRKTGFCWDIILYIAQYLSVNDSVNVFTSDILPFLHRYKVRLHLSEPSDEFNKLILRTINPEQIISLCLKTVRFWPMIDLSSLSVFTQVISLTLFNPLRIEQINEYEQYFPKLYYLTLHYDDEVDLYLLNTNINKFSKPIKRLKILCRRVICSHCYQNILEITNTNSTIEYFELDIAQFLLGSMNSCDKHRKSCLLPTLIKLITNITNIRHIRLITNKHGLNQLLYEDEWKNLVNSCHNLKTLTFEMTENILQNNQLSKKLLKIQNTIHYFGKTIKFRFICV
ncbi:unnamed protein product [Rotaria sp. Silwood1]|nr:unnamed protein product [Rotaria sp. Silwood1]